MSPLRRLQPALAAFLAACVVLLGLAAHSPALHDELCHIDASAHDAASDAEHHHEHSDDASTANASDDDHVCAIALFGNGCTFDAPVTSLTPLALNATTVAQFTDLLLARTLRGPERVCGPPALA